MFFAAQSMFNLVDTPNKYIKVLGLNWSNPLVCCSFLSPILQSCCSTMTESLSSGMTFPGAINPFTSSPCSKPSGTLCKTHLYSNPKSYLPLNSCFWHFYLLLNLQIASPFFIAGGLLSGLCTLTLLRNTIMSFCGTRIWEWKTSMPKGAVSWFCTSSKNMDIMFLFLQIMSGVETVLRFDVQSYLPTLLSIDWCNDGICGWTDTWRSWRLQVWRFRSRLLTLIPKIFTMESLAVGLTPLHTSIIFIIFFNFNFWCKCLELGIYIFLIITSNLDNEFSSADSTIGVPCFSDVGDT